MSELRLQSQVTGELRAVGKGLVETTKPRGLYMQTANGWTAERVDLVKRLWEGGDSATLIGERLGISRNAVIGKVHRLGLPGRSGLSGRRKPYMSKKRRSRPPKGRQHVWERPVSARRLALMQACLDGQPLPPPSEADIGRVDIHELEHKHCRWPCLELPRGRGEQQRFCGLEIIPGLAYCRAHAVRAFQTPVAKETAKVVQYIDYVTRNNAGGWLLPTAKEVA